mgnify:CR=1 FL=1
MYTFDLEYAPIPGLLQNGGRFKWAFLLLENFDKIKDPLSSEIKEVATKLFGVDLLMGNWGWLHNLVSSEANIQRNPDIQSNAIITNTNSIQLLSTLYNTIFTFIINSIIITRAVFIHTERRQQLKISPNFTIKETVLQRQRSTQTTGHQSMTRKPVEDNRKKNPDYPLTALSQY